MVAYVTGKDIIRYIQNAGLENARLSAVEDLVFDGKERCFFDNGVEMIEFEDVVLDLVTGDVTKSVWAIEKGD